MITTIPYVYLLCRCFHMLMYGNSDFEIFLFSLTFPYNIHRFPGIKQSYPSLQTDRLLVSSVLSVVRVYLLGPHWKVRGRGLDLIGRGVSPSLAGGIKRTNRNRVYVFIVPNTWVTRM